MTVKLQAAETAEVHLNIRLSKYQIVGNHVSYYIKLPVSQSVPSNPVPEQSHEYDPTLLVHTPLFWHVLLREHSSTSRICTFIIGVNTRAFKVI